MIFFFPGIYWDQSPFYFLKGIDELKSSVSSKIGLRYKLGYCFSDWKTWFLWSWKMSLLWHHLKPKLRVEPRKMFQNRKNTRLTSVKVFKHLILIYTLAAEIHKGFRFQGPAGKGLQQPPTNTTLYKHSRKSCIEFCTAMHWSGLLFVNPKSLTYPYFLSYQVSGVTMLLHWWQHRLDYWSWKKPRENAGFLKYVVETWQQASLRQKGRSCKRDETFLLRFPSACEKCIKRCSKRHKYFGKIMALLLGRTLEATARGETQFTEAKQVFHMMLSPSFTSVKLGFFFFASFMPSSPHLAYDLHQNKPAKLPSSLPQQHLWMEGSILRCDPQVIAVQVRKRGLFVT